MLSVIKSRCSNYCSFRKADATGVTVTVTDTYAIALDLYAFVSNLFLFVLNLVKQM